MVAISFMSMYAVAEGRFAFCRWKAEQMLIIRNGLRFRHLARPRQSALLRRWASGVPLPRPQLLFQDNHLLVVNKPAGWHSIPNKSDNKEKCLLTFLQNQRLGGGSQSTFLLPLHRLDQPCTGVILFGKTNKIAGRVQSNWTNVQKSYVCVLSDEKDMDRLLSKSNLTTGGGQELTGFLRKRSRGSSKGWSVQVGSTGRECRLTWQPITSRIVHVRTNQGARHMVRALLQPLAGDLRYGAHEALDDRSVALHARYIGVPGRGAWTAPIPYQWDRYFGIREEDVQTWEELTDQ